MTGPWERPHDFAQLHPIDKISLSLFHDGKLLFGLLIHPAIDQAGLDLDDSNQRHEAKEHKKCPAVLADILDSAEDGPGVGDNPRRVTQTQSGGLSGMGRGA